MIFYLQLAAGLILLFGGAEFLVRGAVSLARRYGLPPLVIGLTIVAYGTTAPELVVSVDAALSDAPGIAVGNVIGSNIANILLILGTAGLIYPVTCEAGALHRDGPIVIGVAVVFLALAQTGTIDHWHGAAMLAMLATFSIMSFRSARRRASAQQELSETEEALLAPRQSGRALALSIVGGLVGVVLGAHFLVEGAVTLAREFGVSEAAIGLTLVAVGTSLPELATAVVAAYRGHPEVAIGNVLGANIFNLLAIMGLVSLIKPLDVPQQIIDFDLWVMLGVTLVAIPWMMFLNRLGRPMAGLFLILYAAYVWAQFAGLSGIG